MPFVAWRQRRIVACRHGFSVSCCQVVKFVSLWVQLCQLGQGLWETVFGADHQAWRRVYASMSWYSGPMYVLSLCVYVVSVCIWSCCWQWMLSPLFSVCVSVCVATIQSNSEMQEASNAAGDEGRVSLITSILVLSFFLVIHLVWPTVLWSVVSVAEG